jgi:hypothetical protein
VPKLPPVAPVRGHLSRDWDAHRTINARHRARDDHNRAYLIGGTNRGHHGGGREHDQSPSPQALMLQGHGRSEGAFGTRLFCLASERQPT